MRIKNGLVFQNGSFIKTDIEFDEKITAVGALDGPAGLDGSGCYVIPGMVDIHTHGAVGEDFSDGKPEGLPALVRHYARHGVTSFLATTMTLKETQLTLAMEAIRGICEQRPEDGARCAGIHLEGPFLSYAKRGAQAAENLHKPDATLFYRLNAASGGNVRLVTVAPEEEGALPFIREVSKVCTVSLGHTTADYDTAMAAYQAGASHATHLYNGMPSLLHRTPGVVGAALDSGATVELICDGLHIHPSVIRLTHRLFGEKLVIISDSLRCAGMPDGEYELGGQPIEMKSGRATLKGSNTLAGSSTNLLTELRNVTFFGLSLEEAVTALTLAPAKAVRLDREIGSLEPGKRGDVVVLRPDLTLEKVYIGGKEFEIRN